MPQDGVVMNYTFDNAPLVLDLDVRKEDLDYAADELLHIDGTAAWQGDVPSFRGFGAKAEFFIGGSASGAPAATAAFAADANGKIDLPGASLASGSWPCKANGANVIPLGTVRVSEASAPEGCSVNPKQLVGHVVAKDDEAAIVGE